jgi:hypothetical protein
LDRWTDIGYTAKLPDAFLYLVTNAPKYQRRPLTDAGFEFGSGDDRGMRNFKYSRRLITLMVEAVLTSETSVYFNEITRRYIQEGCHHTRRRENLKSYPYSSFKHLTVPNSHRLVTTAQKGITISSD